MITCYALLRKGERNLYLSPYLQTEKTSLWDPEEAVVLKSSGMLTKSQKDEASYALYAAIDFSVDRWIQDKQYVPRLLVSSLVFMVVYFFMSLVIRDPIPMVDELLISSGLTIFSWIALAKRDTRSSLAIKRRYELKASAGSPDFLQDEGLFALESYLEDSSQLDRLDLCNSLCLSSKDPLAPLSYEQAPPWVEEVLLLLELHMKVNQKFLYRYYKKVCSLREGKRTSSKLSARLFHLSMQQKLDIPQLSLCVALREQMS